MPELNFTPEQRAAIDTRGSTVLVSAAAGSGKTRVLTERLMAYLTDAENPADIDRFLVITYTRAAAAELRSRILDGIYARIASDPENRRLRRQVALCARAEIGTIHSFCADFLRANCAALALAPDFQVADTERCAALRATALEHTLERAYTHIDTDAPFRLLADTVGGGRDDARLGELVLSLYDKMQCHARPEQWAQRQVDLLALDGVADAGATPWGRSLLARVRESAVHWARVLDEQLDIMAAQDMEWLYGIYGTSFGATADGLRAVVRACDQSWDAAVAALQDVPFPRLGITRKPPDPDVRDRVKAQRDAAKKAIQTLQKQINVPSTQALQDLHATAPAMRALLALTLDFGAAYTAEKRRRSLVDFSDLEHMTAQLLTDDDGAPTELARQLSGRYTEIMIDEYQDVSEVQDLIFRAVSREGNNLFFVGDVKQSIYRFRLADPTIFLDKYARFADFAQPRPVRRGASSCGRISAPAARCWPRPTTSFPTSCPARSASWTMTTRPACAPEQATRTTAKSRSLPCSSCRTRTTTRPRRKRPRWRRTTLRGASARSSTAARPCGKTAPSAPRTMATWSSCCAAPTASAPYTALRSRRTASPCRRRRAAGSTRPRRCRCCARCWRWWTIRTRTCR